MGKEITHSANSSNEFAVADSNQFDVMIDFTAPEATLSHLETCQQAGKAIVIGTTGFTTEQLDKIKNYSQDIPIVLAANTSRGIQLCVEMLEKLTHAVGEEADIEIIEAHHRHKKDAPSGTALKLGDAVAKSLGAELQDIASFERHGISETGRDKKIGFSVIRAGDIVGEHTTLFTLPGERIEIKHIATSRKTFAEGALAAAKWLKNQKPGLYSMKDVLEG
tara:strand:+ start:8082 stop:8744 length:663 start_codon:yes stop_codon:yes gene_type:complete